ncbi:MAG: integrin alpha, partial [Bdellovibrionota bacterium]
MYDFKSLPSRFLAALFLFFSISGQFAIAQGGGCDPVATIPHGVDGMYTDATGGSSLRGRSLVTATDGILRLYQLTNNGSPILVGEQVLPISGVSTHLSTDGTTLSVAYNSLAPIIGSSYTSAAALRKVDRFSLSNLAPLSSLIDERVNNIIPQYECLPIGPCADVYAPDYAWENWEVPYRCALEGTCNGEGKLGRFFVSSGGVGTLLNNREVTPNYLQQNFPECVSFWDTSTCNFTEGGMVAGSILVVGHTLFATPEEQLLLPSVPELIDQLKNLHPCNGFFGGGHCMTEADFEFSYYTDVAVDHDTGFAIVGMRMGVQPDHIADMQDTGMVSLIKLGTNSLTHAAGSAVTEPIAGQRIGFSVAAVGSAEFVDETGALVPAFVVASGAPGNGHPSASLPANACTTISAASIPPTEGGAVLLSSHNAASGRLGETVIFYRQEAGHQFGYDVAAAGDLNGDSHPELIAGAPTGQYAMIFSQIDEDLNSAVTIEGSSAGFGKQVGV